MSGNLTTLSGNYQTLSNRLDNQIENINSKIFVTEFNWVETGWYRIWSDGWIEQGGRITTGSINSISYKVTFPKAMNNSAYIVNVAVAPNTSNIQLNAVFGNTTTTGMNVYCSSDYGASYTFGWLSWHIEGIMA